jgi:NAD+ synthase (glutamine-hydrolysing)
LKIRLAQINPVVGDIGYNISIIKDIVSKSTNFDIVIFPELSVTGYPPQDLLKNERFIDQAQRAFNSLVSIVNDSVVIIGYPRLEKESLFNSAAVIQNGKVIYNHDKVLLPTYDVFDEKRYFSSSSEIKNVEISIDGKPVSIGVQICEDLWDADYELKVADKMIAQGAEFIVNISASPYRKKIFDKRLSLCVEKSIHLKYYFIYCNMVGAQDELIFDGRSFIVDNKGKLKALGGHCESALVDFDSSDDIDCVVTKIEGTEEIFKALCLGDYAIKHKDIKL